MWLNKMFLFLFSTSSKIRFVLYTFVFLQKYKHQGTNMPISCEDWMKALNHISDAEELKVSVKGSFYGSLLVGITTMIFSLILGPVGLLLGGIIGGCIAFYNYTGSYKPLSSVLKDLNPEQRTKLFNDLSDIRSQITMQDYVELVLLLQGKSGLIIKKQLLDVLFCFVKDTLNISVKK